MKYPECYQFMKEYIENFQYKSFNYTNLKIRSRLAFYPESTLFFKTESSKMKIFSIILLLAVILAITMPLGSEGRSWGRKFRRGARRAFGSFGRGGHHVGFNIGDFGFSFGHRHHY